MTKILKKAFVITIAVSIVITLVSGCKNDNNTPQDSANNGTSSNGGTVGEQSEYIYIAQSVSFPREVEGIFSIAYYDGKVYFSGTATETSDTDDDSAFITNTYTDIYSMNIDGTEPTELPSYNPPISEKDDISSYVFVQKIAVDNNGFIWVVEEWNYSTFDLPPGFDAENDVLYEHQVMLESGVVIRKLDTDGSELLSIDVTDLQGNYEFLFVKAFAIEIAADSNGELICLGIGDYTQPGQSVYVLDSDGNIRLQIRTDYSFARFIKMPDGTMAMPPNQIYQNTGNVGSASLPTIDFTINAQGRAIEVSGIEGLLAYGIEYYKGTDDTDLLVRDDNSLYGYSLGENSPVWLLDWIDCNVITGRIQDIFMMPDGRIICINSAWSGSVHAEIIILTKTHISELPEKEVIILAGFIISSRLEQTVAEFNKTSLTHRIEIKTYGERNTEAERREGLTRLITDMTTGTVPDILETHFLQGMGFENTGLYTDLYPYIDADPELDRSDFIQPAFAAVETDGKLYHAFPSFAIRTIIGHPSILGSKPGWDMEDFIEVLDNNPNADLPMGYSVTKTELLRMLASINIDDFIDWDKGTASFDSEIFIQLLDVCDRFPDNIDQAQDNRDAEAISDGRQIMAEVFVQGFTDNQINRIGGRAWLDGEYLYKGYPSSRGISHSVIPQNGLAIVDSSPNKDAAWAFVRTMFNGDWQVDNAFLGFPSNLSAFDRQIAVQLDENIYFSAGASSPSGAMVTLERPTQEEVDVVCALIDSIPAGGSGGRSVDETLLNIITEGAADFFSGRVSAQDAARIIQSSASMWISERS